jgi:PAS domain S-box-containing protein
MSSGADRLTQFADLICLTITASVRTENALQESEERFRTLADNIAQLAWMADPRGWISWYNKRWFDYTGTSLEEVEGWGWQKVHHPDYVDQVVAKVSHCFKTGQVWEDTFPLRDKDGQYRWFLSRAIPIRDNQGHVTRWFGTNTDVTEQREAEQALREADRRKDEFLATLGHELRNPLAPIQAGLEVIKMAKDDPNVLDEICLTMERQIEHLVRLIDDLLDMSRITMGKITLQKEQMELSPLIKSALDAVDPLIKEKGHELTVSLPPDPLYLEADATRVLQMMTNLLTNAARYTAEGGHIWLMVQRQDTDAIIKIRDNGLGIPPHKLKRVFEMFMQTSKSKELSNSGLGIGLTLVQKLVEMHHGSVEAHSEGYGQGSEFILRLPLLTPHEYEAKHGNPEAFAATNQLRVLIVDDNTDAVKMLSLLVKGYGCEVQTASDGRQAIEAAASFRPAIVLMDLGMPNLNGYEAADYIKSQSWGQNMYLVALSGWGQEADKERTKTVGFDDHLIKPVKTENLQRLLARAHSEMQPSGHEQPP